MNDETENLSTAGVLPERVTGEKSSTPAVETTSATPPPPVRLSNADCLAILTSSHMVAGLDDAQKRALFRAVHALARRVAQKERNARSRAARGIAPAEPVTDLQPNNGDETR